MGNDDGILRRRRNIMTLTVILGVLLAISEGLAMIPSLKSNSILQFVMNLIKSLENLGGGSQE